MPGSILFFTVAAIAITSGILVIVCRNPINSALALANVAATGIAVIL